MKWIFVALSVLLLDLIRQYFFSRKNRSENQLVAMIIVSCLIAMVLFPYLVEGLFIIIILETMTILIGLVSILSLKKRARQE
jgi:uncharacterized membrane protein